MYPATLDEWGYNELYHRCEIPEERYSDVPTPPVLSFLMLTVWVVVCLLGFGVALLAKQPIAGILMIAVPTFMGMVLKPSFALCILMMVLPTGAGVGLGQAFSLDRAVGLGVALSFFLNTISHL